MRRGRPAWRRSSCSNAIGRQRSSTTVRGSSPAIVAASTSRCSAHRRSRVARASSASSVTTFISVSFNSECAFRFAEPTVSQRSSTIPTLACTYRRSSRSPLSERIVVASSRPAPSSAAASTPSCPSVSSCPLLALAGSTITIRNSSRGGRRSLSASSSDDLRRPQELVLEVDEALRAAERAHVALEDPVLAVGDRVVHAVRDRPHDLDGVTAGGWGRGRPVELLAGQLPPAEREVILDVGERGSAQARADVVPAEPAPRRMVARVEPVAGVVGHVDAADERDFAVDDHRLFVMAVERVLARIDLAADPRAADQVVDALAHLLARRVKRRHRRARPHEHPDVDPLGRLGQQLAEHPRPLAPDELEVRRDVPPGDVDVVPGVLDRVRDRRERLRAVDEHVERAAGARRWIARRPRPVVGRGEGTTPAEAAQAPVVLGADRRLDAVADDRVDAEAGANADEPGMPLCLPDPSAQALSRRDRLELGLGDRSAPAAARARSRARGPATARAPRRRRRAASRSRGSCPDRSGTPGESRSRPARGRRAAPPGAPARASRPTQPRSARGDGRRWPPVCPPSAPRSWPRRARGRSLPRRRRRPRSRPGGTCR